MTRARITLLVLCLALAAAAFGWLALRGGTSRERGTSSPGALPAAQDVRPGAELAPPAEARAFAAESAPTVDGATGRSLAVQDPVEDLDVPRVSRPQIAGRVVRPGTGEPVPGAQVALAWDDQGKRPELKKRAQEDGGFVFTLRGGLPPRIELTVSDSAFNGSQRYELEVPSRAVTFDAGALALRALRTLAFVVRDAAGAPIQGAAAWELPARVEGRMETMTDGEGRGELQVSLDASALRCGALGFETVQAPLPPGEELLAITLRQGTVLEVRFGAEALGRALRVHATEAPFDADGKPSWVPVPPLHLAAHEPRLDGSASTTYRGATDGVYLLNGVRPGIALALEVLDAHGSVLLKESVPPLAAGERRVVELAVSSEAGVLSGRVLSPDGAPLLGAKVIVGPVGGQPGGAVLMLGGRSSPAEDAAQRTDAAGRFRIEHIATESVQLAVTHSRHAPLLIAEQPVSGGLELVLERGRSVRVAVHGPGGQRVPGASVFLAVGSPPWAICETTTARDTFVWEHASCVELTAVAIAGGRSFERPLAAGCAPEELDVEIPAWQTCTVRLTGVQPERGLFVELKGPGQHFDGARETQVRFDVVFPGRYQAHVMGLSDGLPILRSESVAIEVTADSPARVTVEMRER